MTDFYREKTKLQKKHRELENLKKSASELERTTRRRTEFDFDLWTDPEAKTAKEINENEWLSLNAKNQSLKIGHLQKIKAPEDLLELRSDLKAVESKLTSLKSQSFMLSFLFSVRKILSVPSSFS